MTALSQPDCAYIAREIEARSGIVLAPEKFCLIETRVSALARREGFFSVQELVTTARARRDERLITAMAETLISSETQFFRDRAAFDFFRTVMTADIAARRPQARIRIWCAGSGSGQEAYSLAMLLEEMKAEGRGLDCEIVATDISLRLLEKAREGLYSQFEVQRGLPIQYLVRHFEKFGEQWRISDRVRARVQLKAHNLLADAAPLGAFDIVFCRNVIGQFSPEARGRAVDNLASVLNEGGYMALGQNETTDGALSPLTPIGGRAGVYIRTSAARRAA